MEELPVEFNDRRPSARPTDNDFSVPLTRSAIAQANKRLVDAAPLYRTDSVRASVVQANRDRFKARRNDSLDYDNIGSYLDRMTR